MKTILALVIALCASPVFAQNTIVSQLLDASVTIASGGSQGSGVLITRGDTTFVLTAAHVIDNMRTTRSVVVDGVTKTVVEFGDVAIVQEFKQEGRRIGESKMDCRVLRFSDAEQGHDIALLVVRKKNFATASVEFIDDTVPEPGLRLTHVGSFLGKLGSNSVSGGLLSQTGRVVTFGANGVVFDQVSTPGWPGSSGGGVFREDDGKYIGMLVRGAGETFCLVSPSRRIREWAKTAKVEFIMDPSLPVPTVDDIAKEPLEDAGASFGVGSPSPASLEFPFLLHTTAADVQPMRYVAPHARRYAVTKRYRTFRLFRPFAVMRFAPQ